MELLQAIRNDSSTISAIANVGMLVVWLAYAHLLYRSHRRQRKPRLRINQVGGYSLDSACLVANLGHECTYIDRIFVCVQTSQGLLKVDWTDRRPPSSAADRASKLTRQGPLAPGDYMLVGPFNECLSRVDGDERLRLTPEDAGVAPRLELGARLQLRVVAYNGPEALPVGAERSFRVVERGDALALVPETPATRTLESWLERRRAARWLRA